MKECNNNGVVKRRDTINMINDRSGIVILYKEHQSYRTDE